MPELPEVETIRQDLRDFVLNKMISKTEVLLPRLIKSDIPSFSKTLAENSFTEIDRVGKLLIFHLKKPARNFLLIHLRMTGQLVYKTKEKVLAGGHSMSTEHQPEASKHSRIIFHFKNGDKLFFNDMRTFGVLKLVDAAGLRKELEKFGIEPLQKNFSFDKFETIIRKHRLNIKVLLLNQRLISGIGNIYADEILFHAKVSPLRTTDNLTGKEIKMIYDSTKLILRKAIKSRGTTFNNYVDAKGRQGSFLKLLKVYGRGKEDCLLCGTKLTKTKVAGRGTVYCKKCQK